jgi:hypothetical protein
MKANDATKLLRHFPFSLCRGGHTSAQSILICDPQLRSARSTLGQVAEGTPLSKATPAGRNRGAWRQTIIRLINIDGALGKHEIAQ